MHYLRIDEHATADDLREAITNLRAKQRNSVSQQVRDEINSDVNELLDLLAVAR